MKTSRRGLFKFLGAAAVVPLIGEVPEPKMRIVRRGMPSPTCRPWRTMNGGVLPLSHPDHPVNMRKVVDLIEETNGILGDLGYTNK